MMNATYSAVFLALAWCGVALSWGPVHISEATARVHARIEPQIAVSEPVVVVIDLQDHLLGTTIPSQVQFSVQANTQEVELQVACTDLYKGGDPASVHTIPVADPGAEITCEHAGSRMLAWLHDQPTDAMPAGWTGRVSETGVFAASSGRGFSQDVSVEVSWHATDPDLPRGEYQGIVRLIGMVRP